MTARVTTLPLLRSLALAAVILVSCRAPAVPDRPEGKAWPIVGDSEPYIVQSQAGRAAVAYRCLFGDADTTAWTGFVATGVPVVINQCWLTPGRREVRAQAMDDAGRVSPLSEPLAVSVLPSPGYPDSVVAAVGLAVTSAMVASPAGDRLFAACTTGVAVVDTGCWQPDLLLPRPGIRALALSADGRLLWVVIHDSIMVVDVERENTVCRLPLEGCRRVCGAVDPDEAYLLTPSLLFRIKAGGTSKVDTIHTAEDQLDMTLVPQHSLLCIGAEAGGTLVLLDTRTDSVVARVSTGVRPRLLAPATGSRFVSLTTGDYYSPYACVVDVLGRHITGYYLLSPQNRITSLASSPCGRFLALSRVEANASIVDALSWSCVDTFPGLPGTRVEWAPDGRHLFVAGEDTLWVLGFRGGQWR